MALPRAPDSLVRLPSLVMFSVMYRSVTSYVPFAGSVSPDGLSKVTSVSSVSVAIDWPVGSMFQGTVVRLEMETSTPIRIMKMGRLTISRWVLVHGLDRTVRRCSSSCGTCAIVI